MKAAVIFFYFILMYLEVFMGSSQMQNEANVAIPEGHVKCKSINLSQICFTDFPHGSLDISQWFYYSSRDSRCFELNCVPKPEAIGLIFGDYDHCNANCSVATSECGSSKHGCCPDGVTVRLSEEDCKAGPTKSTGNVGLSENMKMVLAVIGGIIGLGSVLLAGCGFRLLWKSYKRKQEERYTNNIQKMFGKSKANISSSESDSELEDDHVTSRLL